MIVDLPDANTTDISKKLLSLRESGGVTTIGRVLTLIVVTEEGEPAEAAIEAANDASREHPCRLIVVQRKNRQGKSRLDAQIRVGGDAGASEVVVLELYGELADHGDSVVIPFLLPDTPVVTWWPGSGPAKPSEDPIGRLGTRRITDMNRSADPVRELSIRKENYANGDTDLAWARVTDWRALLTTALDQPPHNEVTSAVVSGPKEHPDIDLLAGWLRAKLEVPVERNCGSFQITLHTPSGPLMLSVDQNNTAIITHPGTPEGRVAMHPKGTRDCLIEELRRLDPDEIYELALMSVPQLDADPKTGLAS